MIMQENKTESKDRVCPWWFSGVLDNPLRRWLHKPQAILEPYVRPAAQRVIQHPRKPPRAHPVL
jgi:hypothetical protein